MILRSHLIIVALLLLTPSVAIAQPAPFVPPVDDEAPEHSEGAGTRAKNEDKEGEDGDNRDVFPGGTEPGAPVPCPNYFG